jgi:hypothetical protein
MDWSQWSPEFFESGKIFDMCQSSITSNAQIYRLNIYSFLSSVDQMVFGTIDFQDGTDMAEIIDPDKVLCWFMPFFFDGIGKWG